VRYSLSMEKIINKKIVQNSSSIIKVANDNNGADSLLEALLTFGKTKSASDIHLDACDKHTQIRFRIRGQLLNYGNIPPPVYRDFINKIKVVSAMRIDGTFIQDGKIRSELSERLALEIRVSIIPTYYGESIVLRLNKINEESSVLNMLGFSEEDLRKIRESLFPGSMIIVSGPTGSGKTTTMYSILNELNTNDNVIITIEDPVERVVVSARQISINPKLGITFSAGLRAILRQDPDVIMIGEIRDEETAKIALNSALTGHIVIATIHAKDSLSIINRLKDLGIDNYLIKSTIRISIFQRLVGLLCNECKINTNLGFIAGKGCEQCAFLGIKESILLSEVSLMNEELVGQILEGKSRDVYCALKIKRIGEQISELINQGQISYLEGEKFSI